MRISAVRIAILAFSLILSASLRSSIAQETGTSVEINDKGEPIPSKDVSASKPVTPATMELLRAIEAKHGAATTVEVSFEQTKESEVFLETIKSKGKLSFQKPDLFRCEYTEPDPSTNLIIKDAFYVYFPTIKQAERYKFHSPEERDQQLHAMVLGFGFKADEVAKEYELRSSEDDAELVAELKKDGREASKVALIQAVPIPSMMETSPFIRMKLWVDKTTLIPQKIWFEDSNGDKTTISNLKVKFNVQFDPSLFQAKFPSGTAIIDKSEP